MNKQLKPCPFCGGNADAVVVLRSHRSNGYFAICERCYARTGEQHTIEEAIKAWNRRPEN